MATKNNPAHVADDMEEVYVSREFKGDDDLYVSINGKRYQVQKGKKVMVPHIVADVIRNADLMNEKAQAYIDGLAVV